MNPSEDKKPKKGKAKRTWDDPDSIGNEEEFNRGPQSSISPASSTSPQIRIGKKDFNIEDNSSFFDEDDDDDEYEGSGRGGFLSSIFSGLSGKVLAKDDLKPVLAQFKQHLEEKNVASEVAQSLCDSVSETLVGKKLGTFENITKTVKSSLEQALTRILTPSRNIDILRDIQTFKRTHPGLPYSIVFMGANGVGKSTNLAKIGSWLRTFDYKVMFAACDTFRSGAVEQLKTHSSRLGIELFEEGYGKDDTAIATAALDYAEDEKIDVVLIDTAGRMQDKEPLMRAISKLVNTVQPNLVLYVGEALVGNEAVDQLTKFNLALMNVGAEVEHPRTIDGIVLTKFDTVDDKVGSAVTMVYTTHVPIVFLGTGQQYTDIKKLQVSTVVRTLLK